MATDMTYGQLIKNGIFAENTIFKLAISLCPAIAVTSSFKNGVLMGVAVMFVQTMVNATIALIRGVIHPRIRIPIFMLVISGWVTVTDMGMAVLARDVYKSMGLYIQLIVAFASILAHAETFASKNKIGPSIFDGIGMGMGFMFALSIISFWRELLGKGTLWGHNILSAKPLLIMVLPAGGFLTVGLLMAFFNWMDFRKRGGAPAAHH